MAEQPPKKTVLHQRYASGPHGIGDPEDKSLRKVEIEVMVPKKMRDIAKSEKCADYVAKFTNCCKDNHILMTIRCRNENSALKECLSHWYTDEDFKKRCRDEYLAERSEYRRTGIPLKQRISNK